MTLLTSVVGTAVRDGQVWHYLDDGVYGSYSNVMTEDVHPPILALRELTRRRRRRLRAGRRSPGRHVTAPTSIARDYPMPPLNVGDVVVSPMMGAYTGGHVVAVQRHPGHPDRRESDFPFSASVTRDGPPRPRWLGRWTRP